MIHFTILTMDMPMEAYFFVFLIIRISGLVVPPPENLNVEIWDGEATAHWNHPANDFSDFFYNVEIALYLGDWERMDNCTGITHNYCDLKGFIHEYEKAYKVRVQLVVGQHQSVWLRKKFLPNESKLRPPSFTLQPTSSSLTVLVHQKPILMKLFPYGVVYTVYLELGGEPEKNTHLTAYIKGEDQNTTTFKSLHWGAVYCVSVKTEYRASASNSSLSPQQCVVLPEREWYIIAVTSLSVLAVVVSAFSAAAFLLCYVRRPEKTPAVLKSPVSGWLPLSFGEGAMEVVTDKGWYLSSHRPEAKKPIELPVSGVTSGERGVEERRASMDSGVSIEPNSAENSPGGSPGRHDDSGCGSLSGSEGSTSSQTEYGDKDGTGTSPERRLLSPSTNLGEEGDSPPKVVVVGGGGGYRRQSPAPTPAVVGDKAFKPMDCHPVLAEVLSGYRAAPQVCICSGAGWCTWCLKQGGKGTVLQADNGLRGCKWDSVDPCKATARLSYPRKPLVESYTAEDIKSTFIHLEETFPMLTALAPQDINMNFPPSLCDVQMAAD